MESMYFVAVVLPQHLDDEILQHKKWMAEKFGCRVGLKSPAHITLVAPFWMDADREEQLKADLTAIAAAVKTFPLATDNFSAFKPRTIFVAVAHSKQLDVLKELTDRHFQSADYKTKKENRPFHPHITIATRDLHKRDFAEAWPLFENKTFREEFKASGLSLLKHNGRTWDVVFTAPFKAG